MDGNIHGTRYGDSRKGQRRFNKRRFLVKLRPLNKKIDKKGSYCEVLVPKAEAQDAQSIIIEYGL